MEYSGCWIGIALITGGMLAALAAVALARRLFSADALRLGHDATGNILAIVGTLYAVLLGLIVVDAMAHFQKAMDVVQEESNCLADAYLLAERLPEPQQSRVQAVVRHWLWRVHSTILNLGPRWTKRSIHTSRRKSRDSGTGGASGWA